MSSVVDFIVSEGLKTVSDGVLKFAGVASPVGWAMSAVNFGKAFIDDAEEKSLSYIRGKLGCQHIQLLPKSSYGGPLGHMADFFEKQKSGMAFTFNGSYFCHDFSGFEVAKIDPSPTRWDVKKNCSTNNKGYSGLIASCPICKANQA